MTEDEFHALMRYLDSIPPPPKAAFYWESDGDPHAKTFYVCHTRMMFERIDCQNRQEAVQLARDLNLAQSTAS